MSEAAKRRGSDLCPAEISDDRESPSERPGHLPDEYFASDGIKIFFFKLTLPPRVNVSISVTACPYKIH